MARVVFEDLSGVTTSSSKNPYDALITATDDDPKTLQNRYQLHRSTRNAQQRAKIVDPSFSGWVLDEHLVKLHGPRKVSTYEDPRNCLVFWARPPGRVRQLVEVIQQKLLDVAPDLWLMSLENLHMTAMEVTHSLTAAEIEHLVADLTPKSKDIADSPHAKRARLIKPMLNFDTAALALSFVPAAGESLSGERTLQDDKYTYHHLRRDLYSAITAAGVPVGSRYVVPSAHLTIARFNTPNVFGGDPCDEGITLDLKKRKHWMAEIELINQWLEAEFWPTDNTIIRPGGQWIVGEEKGLDFRKGTLWYGGGETIYLGRGFEVPDAG